MPAPDPKYIRKLKEFIRATYGCGSRHFSSVPVVEKVRGKVAWQGEVEVFDLVGHPQTGTCYAWSYEQNGTTHTTAVLGIPPVISAEAAVKAALNPKKAQPPSAAR